MMLLKSNLKHSRKIWLYVIVFTTILGLCSQIHPLKGYLENIPNLKIPYASTIYEGYDSPNGYVVSQPVLDAIDQNLVNNDAYANTLLNQLNAGTIYEYNWTCTLQATYQGVLLMKSLGSLGSIDVNAICSYILGCYNSTTKLFSDNISDAFYLNTANLTDRSLYSQVEATAYAVLTLEALGELGRLSVSDRNAILSNLILAININDGGFCPRIDAEPVSGPLEVDSSSILLSYLAYSAIDALTESEPLGAYQKQQLQNFILSMMNQGTQTFRGSFNDSLYFPKHTLIVTYYAIKLMAALNALSSIDGALVVNYLTRVKSGAYNGFYSEMGSLINSMGSPEYYSTAIAIYLDYILNLDWTFDPQPYITYIFNGFNYTRGAWPICNVSLKSAGLGMSPFSYYLMDQYIIVEALTQSNVVISTTIKNSITAKIGNFIQPWVSKSFIATGFGFSQKPKFQMYLPALYEKIFFLNQTNKISQITEQIKTDLFNAVNACYCPDLFGNKTFSYMPTNNSYIALSYDVRFICAQPETTYYMNPQGSYYLGRLSVAYTYQAFAILRMINKLGTFHAILNLVDFKNEVLYCQAKSGIFMGAFAPASIFLSTNPNTTRYYYPKNAWYAMQTLRIIDAQLGSAYTYSIDGYKLYSYLESRFINMGSEGYFANSEYPSDSTTAEITRCVMEIEQVYQLWYLNPSYKTKALAYALNNPSFPKINSTIKDIWQSIDLVLIETAVQGRKNPINMTGFITFASNLFSVSKTTRDLWALNMLQNQSVFYSIYLTEAPEFVVGFSSGITVKVVSVLSHVINHNLRARIQFSDNSYGEWVAGNYASGSIRMEFPNVLTESEVPTFRLEIHELNIYTISIYLEIPCSTNTKIDFIYVNTPRIVANPNTEIDITFGFSIFKSTQNMPLYPEISVLIIDNNSKTLSLTPIYVNYLWNNVNWETITISNVTSDCTMIINFTHSLFYDSAMIVNNNDNAHIDFNPNTLTYSITIDLDLQTTNPDPDPNPDPNPNENTNNDPTANNQLYVIISSFGVLATVVTISVVKKQKRNNLPSNFILNSENGENNDNL